MEHLKIQILSALKNYYKSEHGVSFHENSLNRFLGYWIHTISIIYFDRKKPNNLKSSKSVDLDIANDLYDFMKLAGTNEKWNDTITSGKLLKSKDINVTTKISKNIFQRCFKYFPKIIMDVRFNHFEIFKKIILGFFPLKSKWFNKTPIFSFNSHKRSILESFLKIEGLDKHVANFISMSIPKIYLEGFDYYSKLYGGVNFEKKKIITSYSHFYSNDFLYISLFFQNLKIIIIEHGLESLNSNNGTFDFEYNICDQFYGNSVERVNLPKYSKLRRRHYEKFVKNNYHNSNTCLLVNVNMPKYLLDLRSMPNAHDFKGYMQEVNKTAYELSLFFDIIMKRYPKNEGWTEDELSAFGNWNYSNLSLKKIIKKSNLICVTYPGSFFFDCLLGNLRLILVWDYNKYSLKDMDLQKILINQKILFRSSDDLKSHIINSNINKLGIINSKLKKFVSENYR